MRRVFRSTATATLPAKWTTTRALIMTSSAVCLAPYSGGRRQHPQQQQQQQQHRQSRNEGNNGGPSSPPPPPQHGNIRASKLARVFSMELNKARVQARTSDDIAARRRLLSELERTELSSVSGVDGRLIALLLQTLEALKARGDAKLVGEAGSWILVALSTPDELPDVILAQLLASLCALRAPSRFEILHAAAPTVQQRASQLDADAAGSLAHSYVASDPCNAIVPLLCSRFESQLSEISVAGISDFVEAAMAVSPPLAAVTRAATQALEHPLVAESPTPQIVAAAISLKKIEKATAMLATLQKQVQEGFDARISVAEAGKILSAGLAALVSAEAKNEDSVKMLDDFASSAVELLKVAIADLRGEPWLLKDLSNAVDAAFTPGTKKDDDLRDAVKQALVSAIGYVKPPEALREDPKELANLLAAVGKAGSALKPELEQLIGLTFPAKVGTGDTIGGYALSALTQPLVIRTKIDDWRQLALTSVNSWDIGELDAFLTAASTIEMDGSRRVLRDMAPKLVERVQGADPSLLTVVAQAYGTARVRHENLCTAISERAAVVKHTLAPQDIAVVLWCMAAVEYRQTRVFVELAPVVHNHLQRLTPTQVTAILVAFSKLSVFSANLLGGLAHRAYLTAEGFSIQELVAVMTAMHRSDIRHTKLVGVFQQRIAQEAAGHCTALDAAQMLAVCATSPTKDIQLVESLAKRIIDGVGSLSAIQLGEALVAYARCGVNSPSFYDAVSLRALALVPTCPPMAIAYILTAFAEAGIRHVELFQVLADRATSLGAECPAVVLSAVLVSFASVGIRNDKLFIEMIPRMRHVASYGGPQDVANILVAYSKVGLWHYKLFVRLGERAVQLRSECRSRHVAQILGAYAAVEMRHQRVFQELAPRVQALASSMPPSDLVAIAKSYADLKLPEAVVFESLAERAVASASTFDTIEVNDLMNAYTAAGQMTESLQMAFPTWVPSSAGSSGDASEAATPATNELKEGGDPADDMKEM